MTMLITSEVCLGHDMGPHHPERPARLEAVMARLEETGLTAELEMRAAPQASRDDLALVHGEQFIDALEAASPRAGLVDVTMDTAMGPGSLAAARTSVGAAILGVQSVLETDERRVFCAVRPPGHHAEESAAMGFCFYNGIAIAARKALQHSEIARVAILDFDVHHCNGTVDAFMETPEVLVCSSFQFPFYPYRLQDVERGNIVNTPLPRDARSIDFRLAIERDWLTPIETFQPDLVLVSAGFDAHADDPIGELALDDSDYGWVTDLITEIATRHAGGRVVSILEGGYDLQALARCAAIHVGRLHTNP